MAKLSERNSPRASGKTSCLSQQRFKDALAMLAFSILALVSARGACPPLFTQNFDGVTPPALPAGWTASQGMNVTGAPLWVTSTVTPDTPTNDAFSSAPGDILDNRFDARPTNVGIFDDTLSFRHNYNLENGFDGAVLEISSPNINGGVFTDILDPAVGGSFLDGGYNGTISTAFQSPISGRMAWSGNSGGYITTIVRLDTLHVNYSTVVLRFRLVTDNNTASTGWRIDTFRWNHNECNPPLPTPTAIPAFGAITLVSRLSDARAYARAAGVDAPPPRIQIDFLPAILSNSAVAAAKGGFGATADCWSNSSIVVDNSMGTLRVGGSGRGMTSAFVQGAYAEAGANVIVLSFTLTDLSYVYSLTGELSTRTACPVCDGSAAARLSAGSATIFEVVAHDAQLPVTLSETGTLPPGDYTLSVDLTASGFESASLDDNRVDANFNFGLDPAPTPTATPIPTPGAQAVNLSTRLLVGTGDSAGINGFIVTGSAPRQVLLRGIGRSLSSGGVPNPLADPTLELRDASGALVAFNDNWCTGPGLCNPQVIATGIPPTNDLESAILATLDPGAYTAVIRGKNNSTGVGLVELYDLSQGNSSKLANISTRGSVGTGSDIVITGFILSGVSSDDVILLRGVGPSLTQSGVPNALADPTLELRNSSGAVVVSNDDWQNGPPVSLPPGDPLESVIEATLPPGAYTALLSGANNTTGVGLVEVYDRGSP